VTQENLDVVAGFERQFLHERSADDRFGETLAEIAGSFGFIVFHISRFAIWIVVNLYPVPGVPAFDKFPFGILHVLVLMKENRLERQSRLRSHLGLRSFC
jgi:uncharacterized membrane protein